MEHIIEAQQFDRKLLADIFALTDRLEHSKEKYLEGKILATLFYEPSTRTRFSFEAAMYQLGGSVISTENAKEFSSAIKGETLEDSIRVVSQYVDVVVLRHPETGASERAAKVSQVPLINAGDGTGQHPTQAILDLYTIYREFGDVNGKSIALVGDLLHGRTVRSLAYMLGKYKNIHIYFVSPKELMVEDDIKEYLKKHNIPYTETLSLDEVIGNVDVVYQTRIQKERFHKQENVEKFIGQYRIDKKVVSRMKKNAIIMHPFPRVDEIAIEVDSLKQAAYFRQTYYGLLVRKALLTFLLGKTQ